MGNRCHRLTMKVLCILSLVLAAVSATHDVDIASELDRMAIAPEERTIICGFFSQLRCTADCSGKDCNAVCTANCGFGRTNTYPCSAIAASTCTTTTSGGK